MELKEAIAKRRSIRQYEDTKIKKEVIEEILNQAILAPSGHNRQPWYFVVVDNCEKKEAIAKIILEKNLEFGEKTASAIEQCSHLVVIYNRYEKSEGEHALFDVESIGACMQNICLSATSLELGSLCIGYICNIEKEVNEILKVNKKMMVAIALGYPSEKRNPRPRLSLEEVSQWQ